MEIKHTLKYHIDQKRNHKRNFNNIYKYIKIKTQLQNLWDEAKAGLRGKFMASMHILEKKKDLKSITYVSASEN